VYGHRVETEEDGSHEFKAVQITKNPVTMMATYAEKHVNAFLNSRGGSLYFGIEDDGTVKGVEMDRKMRDRLRLLVDRMVAGKFEKSYIPYGPSCHHASRAVANHIFIS
jgi:predicted HTH transcriptional regulator